MVGVVAAVVIATSSPLWSAHVFVESQWLSVALLSVGLAGFCLHATLLGMLAGVNRWTQYGSLMVTDAGLRVAVAAATFVVGWGLVGYLWATVAGAVAWLDPAHRVPGDARGGPAADPGRHGDLPARRVALDRGRRGQRDPGDGLSGAAQGDLG